MKKGTTSEVTIGFVTVYGLLAAERCIVNMFNRKKPDQYFKCYIEAINNKAKDRMYNILNNTNSFIPNFIEETLTNFVELFKFDLQQVVEDRNIKLY